jgi:30S ribosome assembly GTPase
MSINHKCLGCGITLQYEHADLPGFQEKKGQVYCQACFQLKHYGLVKDHLHPQDLPHLNSDALMVMVSSVLHLDLLFSYPIHRYQKDAQFVYIINQMDLLPSSTNLDDMLKRIIVKAKDARVPFVDIIFMSAKHKTDIIHLKSYLLSFKQKDIYLLGVQNSGKTTIFKALTHDKEALAFKKAGLTQEPLVAVFEDKTLFDMPGLYQKGYLHQFLTYETYKDLIPDKQINPKIYPIKQGQAIFIEGLIAIAYEGELNSLVFYLSHLINFHKTKTERIKPLLEDKEQHFKRYVDAYEIKAYNVKPGKWQLTFADMGMMHIEGPCHLTVTYPKGLHISLTEALFI